MPEVATDFAVEFGAVEDESTSVLPDDTAADLVEAFDTLEAARKSMVAGHHRAAAEKACDAVNLIADHLGVNVYATY